MSDELMSISLNALRTLQTVYRREGISAAAEALDVQQPSVSYTLDRLRTALGDPLFLRQGRGIAPTDRCREMMPVIDRILAEAESLTEREFDPAESDAKITIMTTGSALSTLVPRLVRRVNAEAPKISLALDMGHHVTSDVLLSGRADLVLTAAKTEHKGIYSAHEILFDRGVCIMDCNHPLAGKRLTLEDISNARFVVTVFEEGFKPPFVRAAEQAGVTINAATTISDVNAVAGLLRGTRLLSGSPSRLAATHAPNITFSHFPFEVIAPLNMHWAATAHRSPLSVWLRQIIMEEAAELGPPVDP